MSFSWCQYNDWFNWAPVQKSVTLTLEIFRSNWMTNHPKEGLHGKMSLYLCFQIRKWKSGISSFTDYRSKTKLMWKLAFAQRKFSFFKKNFWPIKLSFVLFPFLFLSTIPTPSSSAKWRCRISTVYTVRHWDISVRIILVDQLINIAIPRVTAELAWLKIGQSCHEV